MLHACVHVTCTYCVYMLQVDSKRIIDIIYVPPSSLCFNVPDSTPTIKRNSRSSGTGLLSTQIPSYLATVWLGSQCGRCVCVCVCACIMICASLSSLPASYVPSPSSLPPSALPLCLPRTSPALPLCLPRMSPALPLCLPRTSPG